MPELPENLSKVFGESSVVQEVASSRLDDSARPLSREQFIEQAMLDYESPLIGYASTILNDIDSARDVVQDTFLRLCRQDLAKVQVHLKSWLFTVCRNRALDVLRKERRTEPLEEIHWQKVAGPGLQPDERLDLQERLAQLRSLLNNLTENQREVIILKFQQGLSYQEIHKVTNLSTSNIGFLIHAGLKRLRDSLPDDLLS
jgi:RNA polymerase sigma factor (sigma-70 family)